MKNSRNQLLSTQCSLARHRALCRGSATSPAAVPACPAELTEHSHARFKGNLAYLGRKKWLMVNSELNKSTRLNFLHEWQCVLVLVAVSHTSSILLVHYKADNGTNRACAPSGCFLQLLTWAQHCVPDWQWECSGTGSWFVTWLPLHTAVPLDIDETELLFVPFQRGKCSFKSVNDPWHS